MSGELWGRRVSVEAGLPGEAGRRYSELRVVFHVEHRAGGYPAKASIQIYNPKRDAYERFRDRKTRIYLRAGYGSEDLIFTGNPVKDGVRLDVDGSGDRVTTVEASDGGFGYTSARLTAKVYSAGSPWERVLTDIIETTGWSRGQINLGPVTTPAPISMFDRPADVMARVAAQVPGGGEWFVRDNAVYVIAQGGTTPEPALAISAKNGNLIGAATPTQRGCRVRALLHPSMRPYRRIVVDSELVKGAFVVTDAVFAGDSWGGDFYMDLSARRLA